MPLETSLISADPHGAEIVREAEFQRMVQLVGERMRAAARSERLRRRAGGACQYLRCLLGWLAARRTFADRKCRDCAASRDPASLFCSGHPPF
jgi:hypothetical protein